MTASIARKIVSTEEEEEEEEKFKFPVQAFEGGPETPFRRLLDAPRDGEDQWMVAIPSCDLREQS